MKLYPIILIFFFLTSDVIANKGAYLFRQDTIVLTMSDQNVLFYKHKLNKQDKIEELSDLFGTDAQQILKLNGQKDIADLIAQKEIIIPVSEKSLVTEETHKYNKQDYIPVVYEVRPKDNLFRIARHYFYQSLDDLMARNKMKDYDLSIGEKIHVGWLSTNPKEAIHIDILPIIKEQDLVLEDYEEIGFVKIVPEEALEEEIIELEVDSAAIEIDSAAIEIVEPVIFMASQGKGMWDSNVRDNGKLLALHQKAKIGSIIELKNNMLNRTIKAKVIGRIPKNVYPDDIAVLVGPAAAKSLGVSDAKFFVEIRYIK